ncbi:MAG: glycerophosphodiester phosphodiesterase [Arcanobacterium sp.]|nr:glycerophosphodiester phosphodiesterase [Arcanobacterium sp.]MDY5588384.1 glycerophosphodiester phosphodiesterase family protein [Arcanobacterium sp.]
MLAHRGGGNEELENSLDAFASMAAKGFSFIETDAHATRDGVVVLFHDSTLARTTHAVGKIADYSWQQLAQVRDYSGHALVRLDSALTQFPDVVFNVDAKSWHVVEPLVRTISGLKASRQVSLASFSERRLRALRRALPGVHSSLGTGAIAVLVIAAWLPARLGQWLAKKLVPGPAAGVEVVQVPIRYARVTVVTRRFVRLCHALGLAVHVWTINTAHLMRQLIAMGADGIITDEPTLAAQVIDQEWQAGQR